MKKSRSSKKSGAELKRLRTMKDEDIDFSDIPEATPEMFARGVVRHGLKPVDPKELLILHLDRDVVEWYRKQGRGYHTRINALLRAHMQEKSRTSGSSQTRRVS